jgi:nucleotide-binding universal stress UspA family protein
MNARQIVVGFDGSESSRVALTWAMRAAKARSLPVLVVHAGVAAVASVGASPTMAEGSHDALMQAERRMVDEALHEAHREVPGVAVEATIVTGLPADALLRLLDSTEMLVVGSRGLGSFAEILVGSTSLQVATHAPCPVVVVRSQDYTEPGTEAGRVVVGVDGSDHSAQAVEFAFDEAARCGCGLTAIYAWEIPSFQAYGWLSAPPPENVVPMYEREARRTLAEAMAGWPEKYPDVDVRRVTAHAAPLPALVAASAGAEVVVVGSRGAGGFRTLLLGSVGHGLLHHAHCPVAVVHRASAAEASEAGEAGEAGAERS